MFACRVVEVFALLGIGAFLGVTVMCILAMADDGRDP